MKEYVDIRLFEEWAHKNLGDAIGTPLPKGVAHPSTRRVLVESNDPIAQRIKELALTELARGNYVFGSILFLRRYEPDELRRAEVFRLMTYKYMAQTSGQECGTSYDMTNVCPRCGWGRIRRSPLVLNTRTIPKRADIALTLSWQECVVSQRLAELIKTHSIRGCELESIVDSRTGAPSGLWYQLTLTASAGECLPPTRFGNDFFQPEDAPEYLCPEHRLRGSNLLSEVYIRREAAIGWDISGTSDLIGGYNPAVSHMAGVVPVTLISRRFADLLKEHKIKGYELEVAHLH